MEHRETTQPAPTKEEQAEAHVSGLGESPKDNEPGATTGMARLDELIEETTFESQAMAYVCLDLCQRDASLGDRITTLLDSSLRNLRDVRGDNFPKGYDFECDIAPAIKWLRFVDGFDAGLISKRSMEKIANAETEQELASEPEEKEEDTDTQEEPKKESYGFNPKERVRAYEIFEQWLEKCTLKEKQAALALSMLLGKQQYLPDERIGDRIYKQWRDEVLAVGGADQLQLNGVPGEEVFNQGFLTAMIIMDG